MPPPHSSPSQGHKRCIFFSTDGVSLLNLPLREDESLALIDSAGGNIRLLRFAPTDAEQIMAALDAGATFRFASETLHLEAPSGAAEFSPLLSDDARPTPQALPGPCDIQRLHSASESPRAI
jgi:hypothetical protein